ncbi:MAG: molybdopterin synthase catalytic subunit [Frankiaceae bacterium]|nr:molybdopterin synthase catalytic subunit [Frankiaceae bacterium]
MSTIRLVAIRETALSVDEVLAAVTDPAAGGLVVFVGTVRDADGGKAVGGLGYSAHPAAEERMRMVAQSVAERFPAVALAAVHRVGDLSVGDLAVVVAAACPHRGEAFAAARALIDDLKETVPIWKHQLFADGTDEWVASP